MSTPRAVLDRRLVALLVATALCYLIGYPVALVAHSAIGWVFVGLGGPLLIAVGVTLVRRLHAASAPAARSRDEDRPADELPG